MEILCRSCDQKVSEYCGYFVCDKCKIIVFTKEISDEEKKKLIVNYLHLTQAMILNNRDRIYNIDQKEINGDELSEEEREIRKTLIEFKDIRLELLLFFRNNEIINFRSRKISNLLYRLLHVSKALLVFVKND